MKITLLVVAIFMTSPAHPGAIGINPQVTLLPPGLVCDEKIAEAFVLSITKGVKPLDFAYSCDETELPAAPTKPSAAPAPAKKTHIPGDRET